MMLVVGRDEPLVMVVQERVKEESLHNIITGLDVRWQNVHNRANLMLQFDTVEKQLAYIFLKECSRTRKDLAEDELLEDEWTFGQMKRLGFDIQEYQATL
jgi:hypothetical protein